MAASYAEQLKSSVADMQNTGKPPCCASCLCSCLCREVMLVAASLLLYCQRSQCLPAWLR